MKLYIQQKIFTWGDKFSVYDGNGEEKYTVEGEILSFGKSFTCMTGRETSLFLSNSSCLHFCRNT